MNIKNTLRQKILIALTAVMMVPFSNSMAASLSDMPSGAYDLDLTHASVLWKVSHLGFSTYIGRFENFDADLALDTSDFSKSSVDVEIQVDSLETAFPFPEKEDFNKKLSMEWFKGGEFPTINFVSKKVSALAEDNTFTIEGDLTLMGNTHPVTLDAKLNGFTPSHPFKKVPLIGFSAVTTLDRTVWGLSNYAPNIGADVKVEIEGEFTMEAK